MTFRELQDKMYGRYFATHRGEMLITFNFAREPHKVDLDMCKPDTKPVVITYQNDDTVLVFNGQQTFKYSIDSSIGVAGDIFKNTTLAIAAVPENNIESRRIDRAVDEVMPLLRGRR